MARRVAKRTEKEKETDRDDAHRESFVFWLVQDEQITDVTVSWSRDGGQTWLKNKIKGPNGPTV